MTTNHPFELAIVGTDYTIMKKLKKLKSYYKKQIDEHNLLMNAFIVLLLKAVVGAVVGIINYMALQTVDVLVYVICTKRVHQQMSIFGIKNI